MSISTDMLLTFVKVAQHGSLTAAANELDISKSVASKRVAQLEQAVKATLFARSTRRIALTPAGETYLVSARDALQCLGNADESLRDLQQNLSGQIRITAPSSWGQKVLASLIPGFLARHSAIEIELTLDDRLMDIAYESIDIALRMTAQASANLRVTPVARLDWVLCAAPSHLASARLPQEPADLLKHPCMSYWRESSDDAWQLVRGERVERVRVHSRYHANNADAVAQAAIAGLGVALLPLYVCTEALAQGSLVRLLPQWTPVTKFGSSVNAVCSPERLRLSRNRALLDYLRSQLSGATLSAVSAAAEPTMPA